MFNLEEQITAWRQEMFLAGIKNPEVLDELESHLREDLAQQTRAGMNAQQAFETAIQRLGCAATLRNEFRKAGVFRRATRAALKWKERRYIFRGLFFFVPLFMIGASFCYFVLMPVALSASQAYSNWLGLSADIWRAEEYISFVSKFILGMGLGFEMPVVILVLVKLGILNYTILSKGRRYMIVVNLVLGALLTTPEVLTQVLMAIPLQLLYEISVWIAWYWERQDKKRTAAAVSSGLKG